MIQSAVEQLSSEASCVVIIVTSCAHKFELRNILDQGLSGYTVLPMQANIGDSKSLTRNENGVALEALEPAWVTRPSP